MLSPRSHILLPSGFFAPFLSLVVSFLLFCPLWFYSSCCLFCPYFSLHPLWFLARVGFSFYLYVLSTQFTPVARCVRTDVFPFCFIVLLQLFCPDAQIYFMGVRLGFRLFTLETSIGSDQKYMMQLMGL